MYSTLFPKPPTSYPQRTPAASARSWPSPYSFFTPVIFFSFFCPRTPILQIHVFYMQTYLLPIPSAHPGYNTVFNNAAFIFPQFVCQNQNLIRSVLCINVSSAKGTVDHFTQSVLILLKLPAILYRTIFPVPDRAYNQKSPAFPPLHGPDNHTEAVNKSRISTIIRSGRPLPFLKIPPDLFQTAIHMLYLAANLFEIRQHVIRGNAAGLVKQRLCYLIICL